MLDLRLRQARRRPASGGSAPPVERHRRPGGSALDGVTRLRIGGPGAERLGPEGQGEEGAQRGRDPDALPGRRGGRGTSGRANSASCWRQRPQGEQSAAPSVSDHDLDDRTVAGGDHRPDGRRLRRIARPGRPRSPRCSRRGAAPRRQVPTRKRERRARREHGARVAARGRGRPGSAGVRRPPSIGPEGARVRHQAVPAGVIAPSRRGRRWPAGRPPGRRSRPGGATVRTYGIAWMSCTGTTPTSGQRRALEADLDRVGEGEEEAGAERRHRAPLAEDQRGEGEVSLAGRHVPDEGRVVGDRQVGAREAAQHAARRRAPGSAWRPPRCPRCRPRPGSRRPRAAAARSASGRRATPRPARRPRRGRRAGCGRSRPRR